MKSPLILSAIVLALALATPGGMLLAASPNTPGTPQSAPTDARVQELQRQVRGLQEQLDKIGQAKDAQSRQRQVQQHWQGMQDYMRNMQQMWDMSGRQGSGMMGHGMMGPGMMGGPSSGWPLPPGTAPEKYRSQMQQPMQRMQEQITKIMQTSDPAKRQRLMQAHWQSMYQDM